MSSAYVRGVAQYWTPYARLARLHAPIGIWLCLLPGWWALALAGTGAPDAVLMAVFAAAAVLIRGAGCTVNDMIDRSLDAKVSRTAGRPLVVGAVPLRGAAAFAALHVLALLLLLSVVDVRTMLFTAAAIPLVIVYPLLKRFTYWPQAWLALFINWFALSAWLAAEGSLAAPAVALYIGGFFWTLGYDTVYAIQDAHDDERAGIKSTAALFGPRARGWVGLFYALALLALGTAGLLADLHVWYLALLAPAALHFAWQVHRIGYGGPGDCGAVFTSNWQFGALVLCAITCARAVS